jgi:hypothetical protein
MKSSNRSTGVPRRFIKRRFLSFPQRLQPLRYIAKVYSPTCLVSSHGMTTLVGACKTCLASLSRTSDLSSSRRSMGEEESAVGPFP